MWRLWQAQAREVHSSAEAEEALLCSLRCALSVQVRGQIAWTINTDQDDKMTVAK